MNRPTAFIILGLLAALACGACSSTAPQTDPLEEAFAESREAVASGLEEGFEESESIDEYSVDARLNPCPCDAPRHEIYIHGRWTRAFLEGEQAVLTAIDGAFEDAAERFALQTIAIEGAVEGERSTDKGIEYPVFEVERLESP